MFVTQNFIMSPTLILIVFLLINLQFNFHLFFFLFFFFFLFLFFSFFIHLLHSVYTSLPRFSISLFLPLFPCFSLHISS